MVKIGVPLRKLSQNYNRVSLFEAICIYDVSHTKSAVFHTKLLQESIAKP